MAGVLYHALEFRQGEPYVGRDGKQHYELDLVDGDYFSVTSDTWNHITEVAHAAGVPKACWPVFENGFDLSLDDIKLQNQALQHYVAGLTVTFQECPKLDLIIRWLREGQQIVYCRV